MRGVEPVSGSTGRMKKHRYSREFKVTAVKLASHPGIETQEVAVALNYRPFMFSRWKREYREGKLQGPAHPNLKEIPSMKATVSERPRIRELACPLDCQGRLAGQARDAALKAYIRFYNNRRLHSGIDYQTPEEYERLVA